MPVVKVLPHEQLCPKGAQFEVPTGTVLCRALLQQGIEIEHACELSLACTTCHVVIREGGAAIEPSSEEEDDLLDKAWGLTASSRLSCQVKLAQADLVVEIPRYTINHAREDH
jgi:2Fe-2S ferredoxin